MKDFIQAAPALTNTFAADLLLQGILRQRLPQTLQSEVFADLERFGARCSGEVHRLGRLAERQPPRHVAFDAFGRRQDEIEVSAAWEELKNIAASEALVATGYERRYAEHSRLIQFAKLYLYHPSSAFFTCPLAMADGAARVLELHHGGRPVLQQALARLTSRDPKQFWTSGQWMTEKTGGSDVSETSTLAKPLASGEYALTGVKWFTSSVSSEMALGLARCEGAAAGSKGLSLFYIPMRIDGALTLPTAELELLSTRAHLVRALFFAGFLTAVSKFSACDGCERAPKRRTRRTWLLRAG